MRSECTESRKGSSWDQGGVRVRCNGWFRLSDGDICQLVSIRVGDLESHVSNHAVFVWGHTAEKENVVPVISFLRSLGYLRYCHRFGACEPS